MSLAVQKAEFFQQDYALQFTWYVDAAGPEVARCFQVALDQSLNQLARHPDLGRRRKFRNPQLYDLRSIQIERPYHKLLVFYRVRDQVLHAVRLIHGARNLPRRLSEPPTSNAG